MANKSKQDDINTLRFVISQIDTCSEFVKGMDLDKFLLDIKACYAVSMALQVICENLNKVTSETKLLSNDIEWKKMAGLRNIISHDYGKLMFEDMYNTVINDLPQLKERLNDLLLKVTV